MTATEAGAECSLDDTITTIVEAKGQDIHELTIVALDEKHWHLMSTKEDERDCWVGTIQEYIQRIDKTIFKLLRAHLPGACTFVFKASKIVPKMMLTPRKTVGLRWPDHPIANRIVSTLGHPILSSSLRISEDELFEDPLEIHEKYKKKVDLIIDGGTIFAENSTIIDFSSEEAKISRMGKGAIDWLD